MTAAAVKEIVTTCTRDCPAACGLIATVSNGRVTALRGNPLHPLSQGHGCSKLQRYLARVYSPERVLFPQRRTPGGSWVRVSWDSARDEIVQRMATLRRTLGSEAILYYQGFGTRSALQLLNERFFNAFGGVTTLRGTLCGGTGAAAQNLDYGRRLSHDPLDHGNARSVLIWGKNPVATQPPLVPIISKVRRQGGKVILVDPVASATTKVVDHHVQPAPGRDLWLALAVAARIFERGWQDEAFLQSHAEGVESYRALLDRWGRKQLLEAADVSLSDVDLLAERLSCHRPAAILLGWGVHRWVHAHHAIRAIDALGAISGNIGISGGGVSQGFDEYGPYDVGVRGAHLAPPRRRLSMPRIGREILEASKPSIEMALVTGGNPVNMAPNSRVVAEAFARIPFLVYCGQFMDDTAECADLFLPVTTYLEEEDIVASYGHDVLGPVNRVIEPQGEAQSHFRIFSALAEGLGIEDFPADETLWLRRLLQPQSERGISLENVRSGPVRVGLPQVPFADRHFPTPSGRFRLLEDVDLSLPCSEGGQWPYALLSVSPRHALCSEWSKEDHSDLPRVTLSTSEGARLGLADGDRVKVRSEVGCLVARLVLDGSQRDDVAVMPRGGWTKRGHGVNQLTSDWVSALGEGAAYYETRIRLESVED